MVACVTLKLVGLCECDGGLVWLMICVSGGVAVCVWCDVDMMAISENHFQCV